MELRHEPDRRRFVALVDGQESVLEYREAGGILDYHHTFVPRAQRGQGIAGKLVEFALGYARSLQLKVRPTCPFVARVMASPAHADLRAD